VNSHNLTFIASPYTVLSIDQVITADTSGGNITINLPSAGSNKYRDIIIFKSSYSNSVQVNASGADLINQLSIANLKHSISDYPHFFFNPILEGTDGHTWYKKRFRHLIEATDAQNISKKVLSCELVPYHSFSWKKPRVMPPTQSYTFELVRKAIDRGAIILIGRGKADWFNYVPELSKYKRYFQPASSQCAYVSPKNYGKNYREILKTIS
jgi:hypothetical protein